MPPVLIRRFHGGLCTATALINRKWSTQQIVYIVHCASINNEFRNSLLNYRMIIDRFRCEICHVRVKAKNYISTNNRHLSKKRKKNDMP